MHFRQYTTAHTAWGEDFTDGLHLLICQRNVEGFQRVSEMVGMGGADDGEHVRIFFAAPTPRRCCWWNSLCRRLSLSTAARWHGCAPYPQDGTERAERAVYALSTKDPSIFYIQQHRSIRRHEPSDVDLFQVHASRHGLYLSFYP